MSKVSRKLCLMLCFLSASLSFAQKAPEGIWEGYDGEWKHVSRQLIALAEDTPPEKFAWRPAAGSSLNERSIHAHCDRKFLLAERHRT
jgi:hypothetical protein